MVERCRDGDLAEGDAAVVRRQLLGDEHAEARRREALDHRLEQASVLEDASAERDEVGVVAGGRRLTCGRGGIGNGEVEACRDEPGSDAASRSRTTQRTATRASSRAVEPGAASTAGKA